ncbi:FAD/NAD(P)-binding domain-containing protein [Hymenopellis radicata]|nr:FAD/NAD(P)-binding domain-containing protein [Hymenopellis radicata]
MALSTRVVIIGAGWGGLAAAKTYLQINPNIQLTIIDAYKTLGGVWSQDRIYPGLIADSPSGLFDFSDLPMNEKDWQEIPASKVFEYLSQYADRFNLREHMRLGVRVLKCTKKGEEWLISLDTNEEIVCDKLIVATGLASDAYMPDIPRSSFRGPVIHSREISPYFAQFTKGGMRSVTVYGGCKSAIDAIIMCLEAGKEVDWVIRQWRGHYPAIFTGRWKNIWMPSIWNTEGWWWRFLHSGTNRLGTWLTKRMWKKISETTRNLEPYKTDSENVKKLMPESDSALFVSSCLSALHGNKTFTEALHEGKTLRVHRATITSMSEDTVELSNGTTLRNVNGAIFATGWTYKTDIFEPLIPGYPRLSHLHKDADKDVLERLPLLAESPMSTTYQRPLIRTPFRLYRYILPTSPSHLHARDLIFIGLLTNTQTAIYDEVSALWGVSFLEGLRDVPPKVEMDKNIALVNAWCERRYLGRGKATPAAVGEVQDVVDTMMKDLGLAVRRKKGWFREWFVPYRARDYKGMVDDYLNGVARR